MDVNLCRLPGKRKSMPKFPVPLAGIMWHLCPADSVDIQPKQPERQFTIKKNTHYKNCWHFIPDKDKSPVNPVIFFRQLLSPFAIAQPESDKKRGFTMSENEAKETMQDFEAELEASFRKINEGDILTGTVISVDEDAITLDLKYYAPGIIKADEVSNDPSFVIDEHIHPGDVLEATVIRRDDGEGNILLSMKEANEVLAWDKLKELLENETVVTVKVSEAVKAGVVAYLYGIRGFIPASQITTAYVEDTESYVGKELEVRVITADEEDDRLVLSGKSVALEKEAEERNHKIAMLVPGSIVEGTVESLMPYGAFINLGDGLTGLVHISQICERRINKPSEVLKEGQHVKAKLLNTNDGKISLSMRALEEEMVDTSVEEKEDLSAYTSDESASTSLGALLKGLKL